MLHVVTETMENSRRWRAYVCPACRLVFKYQEDLGRDGVACPACRQVLQIPEPNSTQFDVMEAKRSLEIAAKKKIRKQRKNARKGTNISWESETSPKLIRRGQKKRRHAPTLIAVLCLTAGLLAYFFTARNVEQQTSTPIARPGASVEPTKQPKPSIIDQSESEMENSFIEANSPLAIEAENLARKFLTAQSVPEIANVIRHPDASIPRIMKLYPDGRINMGGMQAFSQSKQIKKSGNILTAVVSTDEFEQREINYVTTPNGLRIDWESWEGWCEMRWDEFVSQRPTQGKIFRVRLNHTNYYNFDFADDKKWKSYTLLSRDEKHRIYGYVDQEANFPFDFGMTRGARDQFLTLSLKFPANSKSDDQVIIERVVSTSWVTPDNTSP